MRSKLFVLLIAFTFFLADYISAQELKTLSTVDSVDINRYSGLWYEIAKIPNWFQSDCVSNTTATYTLLEDGTIEVINSCVEEDGEQDIADGIARIVDTLSNSKLEVSFVSILGLRLFWGDYWIIGLDGEYSFAVVGTPSRKYGWILSRSKEMSGKKLSRAFSILQNQGYNPDDFTMSVQFSVP